jgi:hypothetical protein
MPKRSSKAKDANSLAFQIVAGVTGETAKSADDGKNPAAVALGRLGGLKGGKARAEALTDRERSSIAKKAALARWKKKRT